jgi:hypothetical protein
MLLASAERHVSSASKKRQTCLPAWSGEVEVEHDFYKHSPANGAEEFGGFCNFWEQRRRIGIAASFSFQNYLKTGKNASLHPGV